MVCNRFESRNRFVILITLNCSVSIMHEGESNTDTCFSTLKENPQFLHSLINKYVKVELIKDRTLYGYIHSIDPIKYSIIILEQKNEKFQTTILPGHAIIDVAVVNAELKTQPLRRKTSASALDNSVADRKKKLISWFKQNLLPVTESEENIMFGNVLILPPYNVTDICTDNPMVAMQVKNIMDKLPENF